MVRVSLSTARVARRTSLVRLLRGLVIPLSLAALAQACAEQPGGARLRRGPSSRTVTASESGDPCAPGQSPAANDNPGGTCAVTTEFHVPDLTDEGGGLASAGGVSPRTLRPLDGPGGAAAAKSCAANTGAGISTCGPNGTDNCCRVAAVPAGKAGTITVNAFDLGVYEVTSGRFAAFVQQTGGNLRQAAAAGGWEGWDPAFNEKLPSSNAEVDAALGPACQARSDVRNYGALTWPSAETAAIVAEVNADNNAQAADIRADATAARLHQKPINCVTYWVAAAFCAWEGGRLPSVEEWTYAAIGGEEQREYAWGTGGFGKEKLVTELNKDENNQSFSFPEGFAFGGASQNAYHIAPPGRKPAGAARWGHQDMAGNVLEWMSLNVNNTTGQVRGGSWEGHSEKNSFAHVNYPLDRSYGSLGFRCASGAQPQGAGGAGGAGAGGGKVVIHRAVNAQNGDHLFGTTAGEGAPAFGAQGVGFMLFANEPAGGAGAPLHRCRTAAGTHFLANDPKCEGQTLEGLIGWTLKAQSPGTLPLHRCASPNGAGHLSTVTPDECVKAGLNVEGTQGFVHGPPPADFITSLYDKALGRAPDVGGHQAWLAHVLGKGCNADSLAGVIEGFYLSPEFAGRNLDNNQKVEAIYRGALGRNPEPAAAANGPAALAAGTTWKAYVEGIARSPEAASYAPARCSP